MSHPVDLPIGSPTKEAQMEKGEQRNENIKVLQNQVNDVVGIMKANVEGMMNRGEQLSELDRRADQLNASATEFQMTSRKVKRKYWWKNCKMILLIGGVSTVLIIIIIVSIVGFPSSSDSSSSTDTDAITEASN